MKIIYFLARKLACVVGLHGRGNYDVNHKKWYPGRKPVVRTCRFCGWQARD